MSRYMGCASGPVGRYTHFQHGSLPVRGYPLRNDFPADACDGQPSESILVEADLNRLSGRWYKVHLITNPTTAEEKNLDGLDPQTWLRFGHALRNKFIPDEDRVLRSDQYHVLATDHSPVYRMNDGKDMWLRVSSGGDRSQYLDTGDTESPYHKLSKYRGFQTRVSRGIGYSNCYAFRFELETPVEQLDRSQRIQRVMIAGQKLDSSEWMDAVQIQLLQEGQPVTLTVNFRFITDLEPSGFCRAHLFDIVAVEFVNCRMIGKVRTTEFVVKLRGFKR